MALTEADKNSFLERGILPLRGLIPRKLVAAAHAHILSELTRLKIKDGGKIVSPKIQNLPVFQQTGALGQMVKGHETVDRLFTDELLSAAAELAGAKLKPAHPHPQLLLSLPHKEEWSLQHLNWHLDLKVPEADVIPGVQAFVLIDELKPQGGATLALAGSHKLHYVDREHNAHGVLRQSVEFTEAPEKFLQPKELRGVSVQIVEMVGRAGDVYLMDLRILHTPSVNSQRNIRMMATNRFLK